jgi:hypothetical protein
MEYTAWVAIRVDTANQPTGVIHVFTDEQELNAWRSRQLLADYISVFKAVGHG